MEFVFVFAIIPYKILEWSIAKVTVAVLWNITFTTTKDGFDGFVIALFVVENEVSPFPILLEEYDFGKFINFKLLVFR